MIRSSSLAFTLWLTGLSGAGKSTLAVEIVKALEKRLIPCELLDGDIVRTSLSKELGFSKEDRNAHVARVGFICNLLNKHGVITVVALIAPYREARDQLRLTLPKLVEVYVDCPLQVCIQRDPKGLYKKALAGKISEFTGISSPYEVPVNPDLTLRTHKESIEQSVERLFDYLGSRGLICEL